MPRIAAIPLGAALLSLVVAVEADAAPGPTETVRAGVTEVMKVLRDPAVPRAERWRRISPIIDRRFDFQSMSRSVLATRWRSATPAEKRKFVDFFSQYLAATYRDKIEAYSDQTVDFAGERVRADRAVVMTRILTGSTRIPVDYKLRLAEDGAWYAYDVVIEGVSLVSNYRNTFAAIAKTGGMQGILDDLDQRLARYERSGLTRGASSP